MKTSWVGKYAHSDNWLGPTTQKRNKFCFRTILNRKSCKSFLRWKLRKKIRKNIILTLIKFYFYCSKGNCLPSLSTSHRTSYLKTTKQKRNFFWRKKKYLTQLRLPATPAIEYAHTRTCIQMHGIVSSHRYEYFVRWRPFLCVRRTTCLVIARLYRRKFRQIF